MKLIVIRFGALMGFIFSTLSIQADTEVALAGAKVGEWTMDYEAAVKLAGEKDLPMVLNFTGSDWCGWCQHMDKSVFSKEPWKKFAAENVVLVTIDFPQDAAKVPANFAERNAQLKTQFSIQGFPTYMVLDSDAKTVLGQLGADQEITPENFIGELKAVTRFSKSSVDAYCKANPDKAQAFRDALAEMGAAEKDFESWIVTKPVKSEENDQKFEDFQNRFEKIVSKLDTFK